MVGIPIDLLWLVSLDFNMGEKKNTKKQIKKKKNRSRKHEKAETRIYRPCHPWMDLP